jgi:hypothetical protein
MRYQSQQSASAEEIQSVAPQATKAGDTLYLGNEPFIYEVPVEPAHAKHMVSVLSQTPGEPHNFRRILPLREYNYHDIIASCSQTAEVDVRAFMAHELKTYGYLFIRNLHDREAVLQARTKILGYLKELGGKLDETYPLDLGVLKAGCGVGCLPFLEGRNSLTHSPEVLNVLEGLRAKGFFKILFGEEVRSFDYKWLRVMHQGGFTGAHVDHVYMNRGTDQLLTMWTPFGDTSAHSGTVAICEGSTSLPSFGYVQACSSLNKETHIRSCQ